MFKSVRLFNILKLLPSSNLDTKKSIKLHSGNAIHPCIGQLKLPESLKKCVFLQNEFTNQTTSVWYVEQQDFNLTPAVSVKGCDLLLIYVMLGLKYQTYKNSIR